MEPVLGALITPLPPPPFPPAVPLQHNLFVLCFVIIPDFCMCSMKNKECPCIVLAFIS